MRRERSYWLLARRKLTRGTCDTASRPLSLDFWETGLAN
jgi:hypothetical protein